MASSEGIDPVEAFQAAARKYQDEVTSQGCCWYLFCDIAVFDRTDHVEMPPEPPASDPEPRPALDKEEDKSEESDEVPEPFDWIYDLGNGSGKKGRAAYSKLPRGKRLIYPKRGKWRRNWYGALGDIGLRAFGDGCRTCGACSSAGKRATGCPAEHDGSIC